MGIGIISPTNGQKLNINTAATVIKSNHINHFESFFVEVHASSRPYGPPIGTALGRSSDVLAQAIKSYKLACGNVAVIKHWLTFMFAICCNVTNVLSQRTEEGPNRAPGRLPPGAIGSRRHPGWFNHPPRGKDRKLLPSNKLECQVQMQATR